MLDESSEGGPFGPWYVAHTRPRQEEVARRNLVRQGYGVYLPQLKVLKRLRHRRQKVWFEPMFPGYLFFHTGRAEQSIAPVGSTLGVACVVRFGGVQAILQPDTFEGIRALERRQNAVELAELRALRPGKQVVVDNGPLAGLEGLVARVSRERVIVLMHLLGGQTRVKLKPEQLRITAAV